MIKILIGLAFLLSTNIYAKNNAIDQSFTIVNQHDDKKAKKITITAYEDTINDERYSEGDELYKYTVAARGIKPRKLKEVAFFDNERVYQSDYNIFHFKFKYQEGDDVYKNNYCIFTIKFTNSDENKGIKKREQLGTYISEGLGCVVSGTFDSSNIYVNLFTIPTS